LSPYMGTTCTSANVIPYGKRTFCNPTIKDVSFVILYGKRTEYTFAPPTNVKMFASGQNNITSSPFCVDDKVKAYGKRTHCFCVYAKVMVGCDRTGHFLVCEKRLFGELDGLLH